MARFALALAAALAVAATASAAPAAVAVDADPIPDEDWGYVSVREGAHMFWWLYGSQSTAKPRVDQPLVMWLQGGPGASSTGFGNFEEMGPLDVNLQPRNTTWASAANLLFVDNPVGTGFSYVDDLSLIPTDNAAIAADLISLLVAFLAKYPEMQATPFYVFCESYGGKMTAGFAAALLEALAGGNLTANFRGIALGDSWIAPIAFVDAWGPFLRAVDLIDANQAATLQLAVDACDAAVSANEWVNATNLWNTVEEVVEAVSNGVNFYNVLKYDEQEDAALGMQALSRRAGGGYRFRPNPKRVISDAALALAPAGIEPSALQGLYRRHVSVHLSDALSTLMNGPIRQKLGIIPANVTWGGQSDAVFSTLSGDFMKDVSSVVDGLLKGGKIEVTVYEGQVDLICCNSGAEAWMSTLSWPGMAGFNKAQRTPRYAYVGAGFDFGAFSKSYGTLHKWDILQAGHMVPADSPDMALTFFKTVIGA